MAHTSPGAVSHPRHLVKEENSSTGPCQRKVANKVGEKSGGNLVFGIEFGKDNSYWQHEEISPNVEGGVA